MKQLEKYKKCISVSEYFDAYSNSFCGHIICYAELIAYKILLIIETFCHVKTHMNGYMYGWHNVAQFSWFSGFLCYKSLTVLLGSV